MLPVSGIFLYFEGSEVHLLSLSGVKQCQCIRDGKMWVFSCVLKSQSMGLSLFFAFWQCVAFSVKTLLLKHDVLLYVSQNNFTFARNFKTSSVKISVAPLILGETSKNTSKLYS